MDPSRLLRQWILVEHVTQDGPPDEMGDPTEQSSWTRFRGYVWQEQVTEQTANGVIEGEVWHLALARSAAGLIDSGDRIIANGELAGDPPAPVAAVGEPFDVAGPPWPARNPRTNIVEYVSARLERSA